MKNNYGNHPCYNRESSCKYARIHLPVSKNCNVKCNYCDRKYACVNESRPGVTGKILSPKEALEVYRNARKTINNLAVVGFAGPGDALVNFENVKNTVELLKKENDDIMYCLSTNGLMLPEYAKEIIDIGITHVTITINAVNAEIGAQIYDRIDYKNTIIRGEEAFKILLNNQLTGLKFLTDNKVNCKVNIVAIKGVNEFHIQEVVRAAKDNGACKTNIIKHIPVKNTKFENLETLTPDEVQKIRDNCSHILEQISHCRRCRADAAGMLNDSFRA